MSGSFSKTCNLQTAESNTDKITQIFASPAGSILKSLPQPPCPTGSTLHKVPKQVVIIKTLTVTSEQNFVTKI